jgi:hypothetical protein
MPENTQAELSYQPAVKGYAFQNTAPSPKMEQEPKPKRKINAFAALVLEISGLIILFIIVLLLLNFFNILSLSKIYPKTFSWLPHLSQPQSTSSTSNKQAANAPSTQTTPGNSGSLASIPMGSCPLATSCKNAVALGDASVSASLDFSGLGFVNLSGSTSAILAITDGAINTTDATENGQNLTTVTLTDPYNLQKLTYKFKAGAYSPVLSSGSVKEKQKIGDLKNNETLTYESKSYSFILSMYTVVGQRYLTLEPSSDGKTLNNPNK